MGVLSRMSTLIKSNLNDLISRAENPEKILDQSIEDMRANLKEARKEVVDTLAHQKVLEKKYVTAQDESRAWEQKAVQAVKAGDDELAREALKRKQAVDGRVQAMEEQVRVQGEYVETLKASLKALDGKIEEAKAKRHQLVSRLRAARVREDMIQAREVAMGLPRALEDDSAFAAFARMEEKILQIEGRVEAMDELSIAETGASPDVRTELAIEEKLRQLKAGTKVEDELEALKRKLSAPETDD